MLTIWLYKPKLLRLSYQTGQTTGTEERDNRRSAHEREVTLHCRVVYVGRNAAMQTKDLENLKTGDRVRHTDGTPGTPISPNQY